MNKLIRRITDVPARKARPARDARPYLFINMAMSADGKIATANREVSSFGSDADKQHLLQLRARADAVMAGARTVDSNPVTMGPGPVRYRRMRQRAGLAEYNLRIIASRTASVNPRAEIFQHRFSPVIVLTTKAAPRARLEALAEVAQVHICGAREINFGRALEWLGRRWGVRRLLCEGGGELNDALFLAGLVDELNLTICPYIFGGGKSPTIADGRGSRTLEEAARMRLCGFRRVRDELFLAYKARRLS